MDSYNFYKLLDRKSKGLHSTYINWGPPLLPLYLRWSCRRPWSNHWLCTDFVHLFCYEHHERMHNTSYLMVSEDQSLRLIWHMVHCYLWDTQPHNLRIGLEYSLGSHQSMMKWKWIRYNLYPEKICHFTVVGHQGCDMPAIVHPSKNSLCSLLSDQ